MAKFNFCIATGLAGCTPDSRQYVAADTAGEALDAIVTAIDAFHTDGQGWLYDEPDQFTEADWRGFFSRGTTAPDASMWHFTLATDRDLVLDLVGMTQEDFDRESAE